MSAKRLSILPVIAMLCMLPVDVTAEWEADANYLGPALGLSFLGSAPQFGVNYERGISTESFGTIGIGGLFRYWSYTTGHYYGKWKYSNTLIGAQGNYHFAVESRQFDPWFGLVLAYNVGKVSWDGPGREHWWSEPSSGGMWLAAHGGARYFLSPTMAISTRIGFGSLGYGALDIGLDFKL